MWWIQLLGCAEEAAELGPLCDVVITYEGESNAPISDRRFEGSYNRAGDPTEERSSYVDWNGDDVSERYTWAREDGCLVSQKYEWNDEEVTAYAWTCDEAKNHDSESYFYVGNGMLSPTYEMSIENSYNDADHQIAASGKVDGEVVREEAWVWDGDVLSLRTVADRSVGDEVLTVEGFDALGQMVLRRTGEERLETWEYDADGRIVRMSIGEERTYTEVTYAYDGEDPHPSSSVEEVSEDDEGKDTWSGAWAWTCTEGA